MTHDFQPITPNLFPMNMKEMLKKNWKWLLGVGIALLILGTISIFLAAITTFISVMLLGGFLMACGCLLIYQAIKFWWRHWTKFFFQLGLGILYLIIGFIFVFFPLIGAMSLTLVLAFAYIIVGIYRGILAVSHRMPSWGWMLLSGLITVVLGMFILALWPAISLWLIGVFIGIDLLFVGWAFIMSALAAKRIREMPKV